MAQKNKNESVSTLALNPTLSPGERETQTKAFEFVNEVPAHATSGSVSTWNAVRILPREKAGVRQVFTPFVSILLAAAFLLITMFGAQGQSYSIDWFKIAGGGGTSSGGTYQVSGTVGQPDASVAMTGGPFSVTGGFWSLLSVVQTAGAPTLYLSLSGNTVTVSWQNVPGWSLQQSANLAQGNWSASSGVSASQGTNSLTLTQPAGNLFFRLKQ
jgi:hypothetical protein